MDVPKFVFGKEHVFPKTVSARVDVGKLVFGNRSVFPKTVSATIGPFPRSSCFPFPSEGDKRGNEPETLRNRRGWRRRFDAIDNVAKLVFGKRNGFPKLVSAIVGVAKFAS